MERTVNPRRVMSSAQPQSALEDPRQRETKAAAEGATGDAIDDFAGDRSDWQEPVDTTDLPFEFEGYPELYALVQRRDAGEVLPAHSEPLNLSGARLVHLDLSGLDLSEADLSWSELVGCRLRQARLAEVDFEGALVHDGDFTEAELKGSNLTGAELVSVVLTRAGLNDVTAHEAHFYGASCHRATFVGADLTSADFRLADLTNVRMENTCIDGADLAGADMREAELVHVSVSETSFAKTNLQSASVRDITHYRTADWLLANINDVDFTGAWNARRHIQDANYIDEFRSESKFNAALYWLWWVTSDCGRSLARWTMWTVLVALFYAAVYTRLEVDFGDYETGLSPLYFSVVTFTTLGFGDVLPANQTAQIVVMSEVILGYISLGGMMSILSDKMARRAG